MKLFLLPLAVLAFAGPSWAAPALDQARILAAQACENAAPEDAHLCADREISGNADRRGTVLSAASQPDPDPRSRKVFIGPTDVKPGIETPLDQPSIDGPLVPPDQKAQTQTQGSSWSSFIGPGVGAIIGGLLGFFFLASPLGVSALIATVIGVVAGAAIGYFAGKMFGK